MIPQEQEDAKVRGDMQKLARFLDKQLPFGWGFVFLAFPFGAGGRMNYVANGDRPDVVRAMYEFIEATKGQWAEHEPELSAAAEDEQLGRARQRVAELERELDKALESRREWMEKVTVDRGEIAELKALLADAAMMAEQAIAFRDLAQSHAALLIRAMQMLEERVFINKTTNADVAEFIAELRKAAQ